MLWRYEVTKEVLYDTSGTKHEVGRSPFWTKEGNTEFTRHFVACVVRARRPFCVTRTPSPRRVSHHRHVRRSPSSTS